MMQIIKYKEQTDNIYDTKMYVKISNIFVLNNTKIYYDNQ